MHKIWVCVNIHLAHYWVFVQLDHGPKRRGRGPSGGGAIGSRPLDYMVPSYLAIGDLVA